MMSQLSNVKFHQHPIVESALPGGTAPGPRGGGAEMSAACPWASLLTGGWSGAHALLMTASMKASQRGFRPRDWGRLFKGGDIRVLPVEQDSENTRGARKETHIP